MLNMWEDLYKNKTILNDLKKNPNIYMLGLDVKKI